MCAFLGHRLAFVWEAKMTTMEGLFFFPNPSFTEGKSETKEEGKYVCGAKNQRF